MAETQTLRQLLDELIIRFDISPRFYLKEDYRILLLLLEKLINYDGEGEDISDIHRQIEEIIAKNLELDQRLDAGTDLTPVWNTIEEIIAKNEEQDEAIAEGLSVTINNIIEETIVNKLTIDVLTFTEDIEEVESVDGDYVVLTSETQDRLYLREDDNWVEVTPDTNVIYYNIADTQLYSYDTETLKFLRIAIPNTYSIGKSLKNSITDSLMTPGVYHILQHTTYTATDQTKKNIIKNWTLTVRLADKEEYEADYIYLKFEYGVTVYKRTYSAIKEKWGGFVKYYEGLVKDDLSKPSKYYTWSSEKINSLFDEVWSKLATLETNISECCGSGGAIQNRYLILNPYGKRITQNNSDFYWNSKAQFEEGVSEWNLFSEEVSTNANSYTIDDTDPKTLEHEGVTYYVWDKVNDDRSAILTSELNYSTSIPFHVLEGFLSAINTDQGGVVIPDDTVKENYSWKNWIIGYGVEYMDGTRKLYLANVGIKLYNVYADLFFAEQGLGITTSENPRYIQRPIEYLEYSGDTMIYNNLVCYIWTLCFVGDVYDPQLYGRLILTTTPYISLPFTTDSEEYVGMLSEDSLYPEKNPLERWGDFSNSYITAHGIQDTTVYGANRIMYSNKIVSQLQIEKTEIWEP